MKDEQVTYSDDFTGEISPDVRTVSFGWLGNYHEVDLNDTNFQKYNNVMQELIDVSRSIKYVARLDKKQANKRQSDRESRAKARKVREWAREKGLKVSDKGRLSKDLERQYEEENRDEA